MKLSLRSRALVLLVPIVAVTACGSRDGAGGAGGSAARAVMGEKLTTRVIDDPVQKVPVGVIAVPASWTFQSRVTWNYAYHSNPVSQSLSAENPANGEAVYGYPLAGYFDLQPRGYFRVGTNYGGYVYGAPVAPVDLLVRLIRQVRGKMPDLKFVGSKDLPELAAALNLPPAPNQHGVGVKVTYTMNGKPVEEEFYAIGYKVTIPYDGPQGRTYQINWGLQAPHSFRAPAGTLDTRRPVFAAIARSVRPNPAWQQRYAAVMKYLADEFNRQLKAGYDQIAAAARLSQAISANNDAMLASIDRQLQASSPSAETRSASATFDDYIRGVETVSDPYYGSSQQSFNQQFHWTDGYGTYRNSNDATYDPNRTEVGNWQLMKGIR